MQFNIDLRQALPTIRAAFDNKELQMFKNAEGDSGRCLYSGPCAIGICIPEENRAELDFPGTGGTSFDSHQRRGIFTCPPEQHADISELQRLHDALVVDRRYADDEYYARRVADFERLLIDLEDKYAN
jgi:hypothetical protein